MTAYVDAVAVGDPLPDAPLFLAPGWYVNVPLEPTYMVSWDVTPRPIRDLVAPPSTAAPQTWRDVSTTTDSATDRDVGPCVARSRSVYGFRLETQM